MHPNPILRSSLLGLLSLAAASAAAQSPLPGWQAGAVVDLSASSRALALGSRDQGLALGHSDISASGPVGAHLQAQGTVAAHQEDGDFALELEEAWLQTRSLPAGLQLRAGRFASQLGYLNEQHPHADDFVQRPLLYRAFLGSHYIDDGLRLNWVAPTDLYLRLGLEVFRGKRLVTETASARSPGVAVLSGRVGGDLGRSHSWQAGLSFLHNRREAAVHLDDEHDHAGDEGEEHEDAGAEAHDHAHAHGAAYSGRRMWLAELAWKWAPDGNNSRQQLRVSWELARVSGINRYASRDETHHASYLGVVYRFAPGWEAGVRFDTLRASAPHGDHFDAERLREQALMLAWKPTHAQTVRVQLTRQRDRGGFDDAARHAVQLQYVLNFGAHPAHAF